MYTPNGDRCLPEKFKGCTFKIRLKIQRVHAPDVGMSNLGPTCDVIVQ